LANNKTAERSEWDYPKLKEVMHEIDTGEFALEVTGFDLGEIEEIMTWGRVDEVEEVEEFSESVNFTIKCDDIEQLESLKAKIGVSGNKINATEFLRKVF